MYRNYIKIIAVFCLCILNIYGEFLEKETRYFKLIYDSTLEGVSDEVANRIDTLAETQFEYYSFYPKEKIPVHIRDNNLSGRSRIDRRTIILYPNINKSFYEERYFSNWIDYYLANNLSELILELKIGGVFQYTWKMKYMLHNLFLPNWLKEGMGIYAEERFGRAEGSSILFDMFIREKINKDEFEGLRLTSLNDRKTGYYGYSFIKYYVDTYGEDSLKEVIEEFSENQITGPLSFFIKHSGKSSFEELESDWKKYLKTKYPHVEKERLGELLYRSQSKISNLKLYNNKLYFYQERKGIKAYDISTGKIEEKGKGFLAGGYEITDKGVYYSQLNPNITKNNNEILEYIQSQKTELSDNKGVIDYLNTPKGMVYLYKDRDKEKLVLGREKILVEDKYEFYFQKLQYQNGYIYFSAKRKNNPKIYIYRFNMDTGKLERITQGENPFAIGNELYYLKQEGNKVNVYKYNLVTNKKNKIKLKRLVTEIVFYQGNFYFIEKQNDGFQLKKFDGLKFEEDYIKSNEEPEGILPISETKVANNFSSEKFKNSLKLQEVILTPQGVMFNFQDELLRHMILAGNNTFVSKKAGEKPEGYYLEDREKNLQKGIFFMYMYSRDAFSMPIVNFRMNQSLDENYSKLTLNYPYFLKRNGMPVFSKLTVDTENHWRISAALAGAIGVAEHLQEGKPYTELFLRTSKFSLKYYLAQKPVTIEEEPVRASIYQLPQWKQSMLVYNMADTTGALSINYLLDYKYDINLGSRGGRSILKNMKVELDSTLLNWKNDKEKKKNTLLVLKPAIKTEMTLNYHMNLDLGVGYIKRFDLKEGKEEKDLSYLEFTLRF